MCEIFGFTSNKPHRINEYLQTFYSHCEEHPHGWGFANFQKNKPIIEKEPVKASDSEYLKNKLANPICVDNALAHIRLATKGQLNSCNCHPFMNTDDEGLTWTLIHNGTIFNFDELEKYNDRSIGKTDSERILLFIIDKIDQEEDKKGKLSFEERFDILNRIVIELSANNNKLNLMVSDGEYIYIHSNLKDSLHYLKLDGTILFSTLPLSDEDWKDLPINILFAFKDGKLIKKSDPHENEYIETEEDLKFIQDYIASLKASSEEGK